MGFALVGFESHSPKQKHTHITTMLDQLLMKFFSFINTNGR